MKAKRIEGTGFGEITIDGETFDHDVLIRLSGKVKKRKKKLSKALYGTSHILSQAEAEHIFEKGCRKLIIGNGQEGQLRLSEEAASYFKERGVAVVLLRTPLAIEEFNRTEGEKIGLFHVTC